MAKEKTPAAGACALQVCAVTLAGYDTPGALRGPLSAARRAYYEEGRRVRVSLSAVSQGVVTRCSGKVGSHGLRWKETSDTGACGRSYRLRGEDVCLFYDPRGRLSRRAVFRETAWIRTDYFDAADGVNPAVSLQADPAENRLYRYDRTETGYRKTVLLPVPCAEDAALQSFVNAQAGEPAVLMACTDGDYIYCTAEEKKQRELLLAKGLYQPDDPAEEPQEAVQTADDAPAEIPEEPAEPLAAVEAEAQDAPAAETEEIISAEAEPAPTPEPETEETGLPVAEEAPADERTEEDAPADAEAEGTAEETEAPSAALAEKTADAEELPAFSSLLVQQGDTLMFARGGSRYRYVGGVENGTRHGRGRTEQENGLTAYEGEYDHDRRQGFGSLYYKNGGLCYTGGWNDNRRHGLGVSFKGDDHALHVGKWENGRRVGMDFLFDKDGRLCVIRGSEEDAKTVFCIDNSGTVISGLESTPEDGRGSEFDENGVLLYTGMHKNGLREGEGTSFYPDGRVEFTGEWKAGRFKDGMYFGPQGVGRFRAQEDLTD